MAKATSHAVAGWIAALKRVLRPGVLDRPLGRASDRDIDAALERAGLDRVHLFSPSGATARHRVRMAHMLAAHEVDVARAVAERWEDLKTADHYCAHCLSVRRCRNWLEWGRRNDAAAMFCPNARLFEAIAAEQAGRDVAGRGPPRPGGTLVRHARALAAALLATVAVAGGASATHVTSTQQPRAPQVQLVMPIMNPERGKHVFVNKGCVTCHAINGVGGHDAPSLDAHTMKGFMNPFDFAARMWNHAAGMIAMQEGAFGEQITLTGQELADLIAFVHDDGAQHAFTEKDLTPAVRELMENHQHGTSGPKAHAPELGHQHHKGSAPDD